MSLPSRFWHVSWVAPALPGDPPTERHRNFTQAAHAGAQVAMLRLLETHQVARLVGVWTAPVEWDRMDPDRLPVSDRDTAHYRALSESWKDTQ